jgi:hypothetical protein
MFQSKAGYIDARPLTANSSNTSCNARPDHTLGHKQKWLSTLHRVRSAPESGRRVCREGASPSPVNIGCT